MRVTYMDAQKATDPRWEWKAGRIVPSERLYGRAMYDDGTPVRPLAWVAQVEQNYSRASTSSAEEFAEDGLFSVSLTSTERQLLIKNAQGLIRIRNRSTDLGNIDISSLRNDRTNPPIFIFPRTGGAATTFEPQN
jgi:hypothetical protein